MKDEIIKNKNFLKDKIYNDDDQASLYNSDIFENPYHEKISINNNNKLITNSVENELLIPNEIKNDYKIKVQDKINNQINIVTKKESSIYYEKRILEKNNEKNFTNEENNSKKEINCNKSISKSVSNSKTKLSLDKNSNTKHSSFIENEILKISQDDEINDFSKRKKSFKEYLFPKNSQTSDSYKRKMSSSSSKYINYKNSTYQNIIDYINISKYNLKIFLIVSLYFLVDGSELMVLSLILSKISKIWDLTSNQKGILGSSVYIGIYLGTLIAGKYSDYHGRKPIFIIGSFLITIFSFFSALINGFWSFLICRGMCGIGIGLSMPSAFALATEVTPTKYRHFILNMIWIFHPFGEIFSICISKIFLQYEDGWRFILAFATLPSIVALVLTLSIKESPKFLLTMQKWSEGFDGIQEIFDSANINFKLTGKIKNKLKEEFMENNKIFDSFKLGANEKFTIDIVENKEYEESYELKIIEDDDLYKNFNSEIDSKITDKIEGLSSDESVIGKTERKSIKNNTIELTRSNKNKLLCISNGTKKNKFKEDLSAINNEDKVENLSVKNNSSKKDEKCKKPEFKSKTNLSLNNISLKINSQLTNSKFSNNEICNIKNIDKNDNYLKKPLLDKPINPITVSKAENNSNQLLQKSLKNEEKVNVYFSDLLNNEYRYLTIFICSIFVFSALVYEGLLYILPQILEEIEELENRPYLINHNKLEFSHLNANYSYVLKIDNYSKFKNFHSEFIGEEFVIENELSNSNFINLLISALMEIPSLIFATFMAGYGRINSMVLGFIMSFIFCIICFFSDSWFFFSVAMIKLFICIPETVIIIYVCEAYPTKIRSLGVGVTNSFHRIGSILTPFITQILFGLQYKSPFFLYAIGSLLGALSTALLPFETADRDIK